MRATEGDASREGELKARLRARGQRVTSQRVVIHRELCRGDAHRSAEDLHAAVVGELPGTSLPTVYATLDLLAGLGLVRKVSHPTGAALYDVRTDPHHHTFCRTCGRVGDLDGHGEAGALAAAAEATGFSPDGVEVFLTGLCAACRDEGAAATAALPDGRRGRKR